MPLDTAPGSRAGKGFSRPSATLAVAFGESALRKRIISVCDIAGAYAPRRQELCEEGRNAVDNNICRNAKTKPFPIA
jgi:hypothetical protein